MYDNNNIDNINIVDYYFVSKDTDSSQLKDNSFDPPSNNGDIFDNIGEEDLPF